jgi:5-methylcytosine-specific restriction endonuclease McrA
MYSIEEQSRYKLALLQILAQVVPAEDLDEVATSIAQQVLLDEIDCSKGLLDLSLAELNDTPLAAAIEAALQGYEYQDSPLLASSFLECIHNLDDLDKRKTSTGRKRVRRRAETELATKTAIPSQEEADELLDPGCCELCERTMPLTVHHLIPKSEHARIIARHTHTKAWLLSKDNFAYICRPCHSAIHRIMDNSALSEHGQTIEALCEHEEVLKWIKFARTQRTSDLKTGQLRGLKYRR